MICSDTVQERETALAKLLPMQQSDFEGIYEAMEGYPVTIRFLDPPLHEFVPTEEADIEQLAKAQGKTVEQIKAIIASLHEFNPMMGHRGCRLSVTFPEIAAMQTRAVIRAAINVQKKHPDCHQDCQRRDGKGRFQAGLQGRHHDRDPPRGAYCR